MGASNYSLNRFCAPKSNIAEQTVKKSKKLREFFIKVLRIDDKELIDKLCCGIEHHITNEVVRALDNVLAQNF